MPVEPVHRGILAADIEGFSRPERSNPLRVHMRDALYRLIGQSLTRAGIGSWHGEETDHGDCVLILFDANIPKTRLLNPFVPRLAAALGRHNRTVQPPSGCGSASSSTPASSSATPMGTPART